MTVTRGCSYAGAERGGLGTGERHGSHQPRSCRLRLLFLVWTPQLLSVGTTGVDSFGTMQFTSDFQERDIVFGGDKKLTKIIDELKNCSPSARAPRLNLNARWA
jgi:nitrogenase molybdenum-iron protein alpha chain